MTATGHLEHNSHQLACQGCCYSDLTCLSAHLVHKLTCHKAAGTFGRWIRLWSTPEPLAVAHGAPPETRSKIPVSLLGHWRHAVSPSSDTKEVFTIHSGRAGCGSDRSRSKPICVCCLTSVCSCVVRCRSVWRRSMCVGCCL